MKLCDLSIRTILGIIISMMGFLALFLALLSGTIHRDLVLNNQNILVKEMIGIEAKERIKELNRTSKDLSLALQNTPDFQKAFADKNMSALLDILNNQFHQYFVTAGILKLEQIVLYDKNFSMLLESSKGLVSFQKTEKSNCSYLENQARLRKGVQRMVIIDGMCLYGDKPLNVNIVPVGGLTLKGYIAVATDVSHNLTALESNLGMPIKLQLDSGYEIFKSVKWPDNESAALVAKYPLKAPAELDILSISAAQDISLLSSSLQNARFKVLIYSGIGTLLIVSLCIFIIRKAMLMPLSQLTYNLRHFNFTHEDNETENIQVNGTKEIREICDGFNYMSNAYFKAQKSDNQKSQFLANMSHEIRTPLTAIIGFSESLYQDGKTKDWKEFLEKIIRNGKHLNQLINDILDLSKIEANQLTIEKIKVPVASLAFEIDSLMGEKAKDKGLYFQVLLQYPMPEFITTDPTRLKQILINLCTNAIKFTDKGSVSLDVRYDKEANKMFFSVKDSGVGMSAEQISNLFKPFKQADASITRKFGGTGLGLYISKQLTEKLGGSIQVSSMLDLGSLFEANICAGNISNNWVKSKEDVLQFPDSNKGAVPMLVGKVLLAEDNADNQTYISYLIEKTGASVEVVENGKLAVEKGVSGKFDLILMDMQMPVMGGVEAIKKLRDANCITPIATLTANAMKEDQRKSEEVGANCFLTKPINNDAFYTVLQKYLLLQ